MFKKPESPQFFVTMETLSEAYREFYESECPIDAFPKAIRDVARTYSVGEICQWSFFASAPAEF